MMNYFKNNTILMWVLIVLLVINASAIGTMIYFRVSDQAGIRPDFNPDEPPRFLQERLHLNPEQRHLFHEMHMHFRNAMDKMGADMEANRAEILKELSKQDPDSDRLDQLADDYGKLHRDLKLLTISHFKEMKRSLGPEQQEAFTDFVRKMMEAEGMHPRNGMGKQGMGNRFRNGGKWK